MSQFEFAESDIRLVIEKRGFIEISMTRGGNRPWSVACLVPIDPPLGTAAAWLDAAEEDLRRQAESIEQRRQTERVAARRAWRRRLVAFERKRRAGLLPKTILG